MTTDIDKKTNETKSNTQPTPAANPAEKSDAKKFSSTEKDGSIIHNVPKDGIPVAKVTDAPKANSVSDQKV